MWFSKHPKANTDLEERLGKLERRFTELELEWNNVLEKIRRMMGRIAKRAQFIEQKEAQDAPGSTDGDQVGQDPYAHLDPVTRKIWERRGLIPKRRTVA